MTIKSKLVVIFLALIILPMVIGIAVLFSYIRDVVRDVRVLQLDNTASFEAAQVDSFFSERKSDIELFQTYPVILDNLPAALRLSNDRNNPAYITAVKQIQERLDTVRKSFGYSDVMLVDPKGNIILVANESHKKFDMGKPLSHIDAGAFEGGRKKVYFSSIYKGGGESGGYGMLCTAPLYSRQGGFIGEAAFEIDAGRVFDLVHEATGLGTTGETFIGIPQGGHVMFINPYHPERNKDIPVSELFGGKIAKPMQEALRGRDGSGESVDYLGHDVLAAWRIVPTMGWGLVAKMDSKEAFAPVAMLRKLALAAELLIVLFCVAAGLMLTRSIVDPIRSLQKGAEVIGSGNLGYKVGTAAKDEVGQLSRAFDRMAENLGNVTASRDDLDREVAERRQAEEALRLAGAYNRSLIEAALDPLVTIGPDGKVTDVNAATEAVTGRARGELIGTDFTDYFTDPEKAEAGYQQVFRVGTVLDYELNIRHVDGRITPVLYNASVYRDEEGNAIGVFAAARDITERKRAEGVIRASLRLSEYALKHSLDELLTNTLDEAESLTGSRIGFFHFVEADQRTLWLQAWSTNTLSSMCAAEGKGSHYAVDKAGVWVDALTERRPVIHNDYNALPHRKGLPPGHAPVIRELVVPILRSGLVVGVIGVGNKPDVYVEEDVEAVSQLADRAWDIILAKRAEDEIKKLNEDLERRVVERTAELTETNKELEAFSYSVSHDLRAPLRHVQGFVEMLLKNSGASLDEKGRRYLDTISSSATRMGQLIDDLLIFSRMGRAEMRMTTVELGTLTEAVIREMRIETEGRDIAWKVGRMPQVFGDPSMLRLVMVNLVSNALKFTKGRAQAVIEIGSLPDGEGESTFFVRDNGAGFDMRYVDKLFGVFQRLHKVEEYEGTGIGLANVRRIISRHGGRTWAEGAPDEGAVIYFTLPKPQAGERHERA